MLQCHQCGREWTTERRVKVPGVKETCEGCAAYLHCCRNCLHFDATKHNQCAIPNTDWIADKAAANFCDEFEFVHAKGAQEAKASAKAQPKDVLDGLFGASDTPPDSERLDFFKKL